MSGHSKWSKIKHQKGVTDAVKGKIFTKMSKSITIAIQEGGGSIDPNFNFKLRLAMEKARGVNMPKENIQRAIDHALKGPEGTKMEEALYEGFGPSGVGILIKTVTDNRQRTVSEIKNILERGAGVLATSGAVSYLFSHVGLIQIQKDEKTFDEIFEAALSAGAQDLEDEGNEVAVYTDHTAVHTVKEALVAKGFHVTDAELFFRPQVIIPISDIEKAKKLVRLLSVLEDLDDVQKVYTNTVIPNEAFFVTPKI